MAIPISIGHRIAHIDDRLAGTVIGFCTVEFISYTDDSRVTVPGITYTTDCGWTRRIPLAEAVKV
jgi:hypothetical protein